jgi:hypothetical protein
VVEGQPHLLVRLLLMEMSLVDQIVWLCIAAIIAIVVLWAVTR